MKHMMKSLLTLGVTAMGLNMAVAQDNQPWSQSPPDGLTTEQVPMFVSIGFDDNAYSGAPNSPGTGGMKFVTDLFRDKTNPAGTGNSATYDGTPARVSFYHTSVYIGTWGAESPTFVKGSWRTAYEDGHEAAVHTHNHSDGKNFSEAQWIAQMNPTIDWLTKPFDPNEQIHVPNNNAGVGILLNDLTGFRAPYLNYNGNTFAAMKTLGLTYDNSIEDGWQTDHDGTNYTWPYTLDGGSPGHDFRNPTDPLPSYPGVWQVPTHPVIVPPDSVSAQYGFTPGLRDRMDAKLGNFNPADGKITGLDYNLWYAADMSKEEFAATLKYTLDLRLENNRAPFTFGAHSDYYHSKWVGNATVTATLAERQAAIADFVEYALSKPEVRIVPHQTIVDWMRDPNRGTLDSTSKTITASAGTGGAIDPSGAVRVSEGANQTFTITPDTGYLIADVLVNGGSVGAVATHSFNNVVADQTIEATFQVDPSLHTITATADANGTISPAGDVIVSDNGSAVFTIVPDTGYETLDVFVDGVSVGPVTSYSFENVVADHTISASFVAVEVFFTVTSSVSGANGIIQPAGAASYLAGSTPTFQITPDAGYRVKTVLVNGISQGAVTSLDLPPLNADVTVDAEFELIPVGGDVTATHSITQDWGGGFCASVTINNGGTETTNGWTVTWTYPSGQTIGSLWDGNHTQTGANVSVTDVGWNGTIAPGASASFGYCGTYSGSNDEPTDVTVQ